MPNPQRSSSNRRTAERICGAVACGAQNGRPRATTTGPSRCRPGRRTSAGIRTGDHRPLAALADFVPASDVLLKCQITHECRGRPASRSRSKPSTATTCRRALPRQSNRELDPTSSCGDELIDLVVAALGAGDLVSHVTDLDEAFSLEPRPVAARHSSTLRRPCSAGAGLALAALGADRGRTPVMSAPYVGCSG